MTRVCAQILQHAFDVQTKDQSHSYIEALDKCNWHGITLAYLSNRCMGNVICFDTQQS